MLSYPFESPSNPISSYPILLIYAKRSYFVLSYTIPSDSFGLCYPFLSFLNLSFPLDLYHLLLCLSDKKSPRPREALDWSTTCTGIYSKRKIIRWTIWSYIRSLSHTGGLPSACIWRESRGFEKTESDDKEIVGTTDRYGDHLFRLASVLLTLCYVVTPLQCCSNEVMDM